MVSCLSAADQAASGQKAQQLGWFSAGPLNANVQLLDRATTIEVRVILSGTPNGRSTAVRGCPSLGLNLGGCYALMDTRDAALAELEQVFELIAQEYRDRGVALPKDTTEIVHA